MRGLQLAGAVLAAGTVLAAWMLPRRAIEPPAAAAQPAAVATPAPGVAAAPAAPAKPKGKAARARVASTERLEKVLARRMPDLEPAERLRLARAILEEARFAAIDPLFVMALIAVESGFDHGAESVRGARGLMQLRDETLEAEAARSNLDGDLDDPVTNVRAGVRYYRRLLRAFGTHDLALMAYNAGPNRILRYLREDGEVPERFQQYPRKVNAELTKLGGTPLGPVQVPPSPLPVAPLEATAEPLVPRAAPLTAHAAP